MEQKALNNWEPPRLGWIDHLPYFGRILRYYFVFTPYIGHRALLLGAISLFTTLTEGLGVAVFIAYLQFLGTHGQDPTHLVQKIREYFEFFHIPFGTFRLVGFLILLFVVRGLLVFLGKGYHFRLFVRLVGRINDDLSSAIASMRYEQYLKRDSGFFSHIVTQEVSRAVTAYYQISAQIPIAVSIITYVVLSLRIDWRFSLIAAFFGGLISLIFKTVVQRTAVASRELSLEQARLSSLVIQLLQSYKYLFSTASLGRIQKRISYHAGKAAEAGSRMGFLSSIPGASSETVIVAFLGIMIYFQTEVFGRGIDTLLVAMMFLYRAIREVTTFQGSWQTFNQYVGGVDALFGTIVELRQGSETKGGQVFSQISRSIDLEKVSFRYSAEEVLREITLSIPSRSMVAFVGESGAGKSTLVDLLTGLMLPATGNISVDGVSYRDLDRNSLRQHIGYVTQESVVFDDTVANNVSLWRWREDPDGEKRVRNALEKANCLSFVERLPKGLDEILGERGVRLSGGQRQRLSIARELYRAPALLILDEATSALDSESERQVQESIDALKGIATIVVIAHRLSTVRKCDRIFVLREGRLVEQGGFSELRENGMVFPKMCEAQSL